MLVAQRWLSLGSHSIGSYREFCKVEGLHDCFMSAPTMLVLSSPPLWPAILTPHSCLFASVFPFLRSYSADLKSSKLCRYLLRLS